jgi:hypothetical protein
MHTFKVQQQTAEQAFDTKAFCALNKDVGSFISEEVDLVELGRCLDGVNKQYLSLHHLSRHPGVGLKRMGCDNVDVLLQATGYLCGFLGGSVASYAVAPLGIVVNEGVHGLRKYGEAFDTHAKDGSSSDVLHLLSDGERFFEDLLLGVNPDETGPQYAVTRFEQLFLGSGYTREMLAAGLEGSHLRPVGLKLSNGDTLLSYAYKQELH